MITKSTTAILALMLSANVFATTTTHHFNFVKTTTGDTKIQGGNSNGFGNYIEFTRDGITMKASAWSDTLNTSSTNPTPCNDYPVAPECQNGGASPNTTESDPFLDKGRLVYYGDTLGIANKDEAGNSSSDPNAPQHSIDNIPNSSTNGYNDYDMVLLEFDTAVTLSKIGIGWATNNGSSSNNGLADMTLLAYGGVGNPADSASSFFGPSDMWSNLLSEGWNKVKDYENASGTFDVFDAGDTPMSSRYWLVGAYNDLFNGTLSNANDGFKLSKVVATKTTTMVPEPGVALLLATGLFAVRLGRKTR